MVKVETEDDYWRAVRNYRKELKKKVLAEVEKEAEKIELKRQQKANEASSKEPKKGKTRPKKSINSTSGGKYQKESSEKKMKGEK